jgi:hypothetical protein
MSNVRSINGDHQDATTSKRPKPEKVIFGNMEAAEEIGKKLIPKDHPELATAEIHYRCRSRSIKRFGMPVPGGVTKIPDRIRDLVGADFIVEVALDVWNGLSPMQRSALVDHLLTRCVGEEDEETGEMKWKVQPPRVQEFPEVAARYGQWHEGLVDLEKSLRSKS